MESVKSVFYDFDSFTMVNRWLRNLPFYHGKASSVTSANHVRYRTDSLVAWQFKFSDEVAYST